MTPDVDAIRDALRDAILKKFGSLEAAAEPLGIAYKTLYRAFTQKGKDRTARVTLEFILDICRKIDLDLDDLNNLALSHKRG